MGVVMIICSLLMGGSLLAFDMLFPGSVINWFAASGEQYLVMRAAILTLLGMLLVVHWSFNNRFVRRSCGVISVALLYGAYHMLMSHAIFLFDILLLVHASVCFAIVAMQKPDELEGFRRPDPAPVTMPALSRARAMVGQRVQLLGRLQRQRRRLSPTVYMTEVKDDSHRLVIDFPRSAQLN